MLDARSSGKSRGDHAILTTRARAALNEDQRDNKTHGFDKSHAGRGRPGIASLHVKEATNRPAKPFRTREAIFRTRDVPRWLERFCRSESSLPPPPPPPGTEPSPGTSQGLSEPPSIMGRVVKSIAYGCPGGIGAARRRAVRPPRTELHEGIRRKETTLWPKGSIVVTVRDVSLRRLGACGQERNCHCRQASQKHSHGSFSVDRRGNGPGPGGG